MLSSWYQLPEIFRLITDLNTAETSPSRRWQLTTVNNGLHCVHTRGLFLDRSSAFTTQPSQESSAMNWPSSPCQPVNVTGSQTSWHTGGSKWGWLNSALTPWGCVLSHSPHPTVYCDAEVCRGYAGYLSRPRCWWSKTVDRRVIKLLFSFFFASQSLFMSPTGAWGAHDRAAVFGMRTCWPVMSWRRVVDMKHNRSRCVRNETAVSSSPINRHRSYGGCGTGT